MEYKIIRLKKGKEESLLRLHPWVFSGAVASMPENIEEGETVKVVTSSGDFIGIGHFQIGSIVVRILSFDDIAIDEAFFADRLTAAYNLRRTLNLIREDNNAMRLVHGEGDFLPGLIVDLYGNTAVVQAHSPGMHFARNIIANALVDRKSVV